jgi:alpha-D-ribose 1-methylphosphonate 5-triphosphate synthase subunit PhnG
MKWSRAPHKLPRTLSNPVGETLQTGDNAARASDNALRASWMGVLARAPTALLAAWVAREPRWRYRMLRAPEPGLVMVRARAGGSGGKFNLGEMTVTRCVLRLEEGGGAVGVSYIQGRSARKAEIAALADALLQVPAESARVEEGLIAPLRQRLEAEATRARRKAQATRVEFFTLAREAGA